MGNEIVSNMSPIKGYEGLYSITKDGRVYSHNKYHKNAEKFLKPVKKTTGYLNVDLSTPTKITKRNVHRLVAETFIPNPENKPQVNHIDGDKTNNKVSNLEWVTRSENNRHAEYNGLLENAHKQVSLKKRKYNNLKVSLIKEFRECFKMTYKEISEIVGGNQGLVRKVYINGYKY